MSKCFFGFLLFGGFSLLLVSFLLYLFGPVQLWVVIGEGILVFLGLLLLSFAFIVDLENQCFLLSVECLKVFKNKQGVKKE